MPLPIDPLRWRTLQEEMPPQHRQILVWANIDVKYMPREFPTKSQVFAVLMVVAPNSPPAFSYTSRDEKGRSATFWLTADLIKFWRPMGPLPPQ
jgi:hypothetical protein